MYKHIEENFRSKSVFFSSVDFTTVIAKWLTSVDSLQIAMETRIINKKCFSTLRNSWLFEVYSSGDLITCYTQAD